MDSGSWSWKVRRSRLLHTALKYAAAAESAGWVVPARVAGWRRPSRAAAAPPRRVNCRVAAVSPSTGGAASRLGTRASAKPFVVSVCSSFMSARVELLAVGDLLGEHVADALRAVAVVPVGREPVRVRRTDHLLVRGDDEALVGVAHRRQVAGTGRSPASPSPSPARPRPGAVGLAETAPRARGPGSSPAPGSRCCRRCRRTPGSATAPRTALRRNGTRPSWCAWLRAKIASAVRPGVSAVHDSATAYPSRAERRRLGGRARSAPAWSRVSRTSEMSGPCTVERTVDRDVVARPRPGSSRRGSRRSTCCAVAQVGVLGDVLEEEVADVGAEVGHAPGDVGVVADDDARQAGEGEARDVERAGVADLRCSAGRPGTRCSACPATGAGRWPAAAGRTRCASRRRPRSSSRCRRRGRAGRARRRARACADSSAERPARTARSVSARRPQRRQPVRRPTSRQRPRRRPGRAARPPSDAPAGPSPGRIGAWVSAGYGG